MKIHGIKRAVGDFNRWVGHAEIVLDTGNGKVWTNAFTGCGDSIRYEDAGIVRLISKGAVTMASDWDETSMREVEYRVRYCMESGRGWEDRFETD